MKNLNWQNKFEKLFLSAKAESIKKSTLIKKTPRKNFTNLDEFTYMHWLLIEQTIWEDGIYPYRVKIKPVIYLTKDKCINIRDMVNDLDYFRNKIQWSMHFMQNLMPVSEKDYEKIKKALDLK